jgi:hypothetical protein
VNPEDLINRELPDKPKIARAERHRAPSDDAEAAEFFCYLIDAARNLSSARVAEREGESSTAYHAEFEMGTALWELTISEMRALQACLASAESVTLRLIHEQLTSMLGVIGEALIRESLE